MFYPFECRFYRQIYVFDSHLYNRKNLFKGLWDLSLKRNFIYKRNKFDLLDLINPIYQGINKKPRITSGLCGSASSQESQAVFA